MERTNFEKLQVYQHAGVPHYWLVDPDAETLTVHRWTREGYLVVLVARRGERVHPVFASANRPCWLRLLRQKS